MLSGRRRQALLTTLYITYVIDQVQLYYSGFTRRLGFIDMYPLNNFTSRTMTVTFENMLIHFQFNFMFTKIANQMRKVMFGIPALAYALISALLRFKQFIRYVLGVYILINWQLLHDATAQFLPHLVLIVQLLLSRETFVWKYFTNLSHQRRMTQNPNPEKFRLENPT